MDILSIDLGSYSIKFIEAYGDRKQFVYQQVKEVSIREVRKKLGNELSLEEVQAEVLKDYFSQLDFEPKTIMSVPKDIISLRFFDLPINNFKKAEQLIPFQLEEDVPFTSGQYHAAHQMRKEDGHVKALTVLAPEEKFEPLYNLYKEKEVLPKYLTAELSLFQNYFNDKPEEVEAFCVLDIGHETSKCYFFSKNKLVAAHLSYVAGRIIDDIISESYGIGIEEAISYKHANAFFLTTDQLASVDTDQREFASLMAKTFEPLINDLKRWNLGHRVTYGSGIDKIYITGGTSNIKNIGNFIGSHMGIEVHPFDPTDYHQFGEIQLKDTQIPAYTIAHLGCHTLAGKNSPLNFLTGSYSPTSYEDIPLHSASFIGVRVFLLLFLLSIPLGLETYNLNQASTEIDGELGVIKVKGRKSKTKGLLQEEILGLPSVRNTWSRKGPEPTLKKLKAKYKRVKSDLVKVEKAADLKTGRALIDLHDALSRIENTFLYSYKASTNTSLAKALFKAENANALKTLQAKLEATKLKERKINIDEKKLEIELNYRF